MGKKIIDGILTYINHYNFDKLNLQFTKHNIELMIGAAIYHYGYYFDILEYAEQQWYKINETLPLYGNSQAYWDSFKPNMYTIGSIKILYGLSQSEEEVEKNDESEKDEKDIKKYHNYKRINEKTVLDLDSISYEIFVTFSDNSIAQIFKFVADGDIKYDKNNKKIYYYIEPLWRAEDIDDPKIIISTIIKEEIGFLIKELFTYCIKTLEPSNSFYKSIKRLSNKVNNQSHLRSIADMILDDHYDKEFTKKIDSNHYLIGFENGIFNSKNCEFITKNNKNNYISLSTGINYVEIDKKSEGYNLIKKLLKSTLPDKEIRSYFVRSLAIMLNPYLYNEKVHVMIGNGSNGKTTVFKLLRECFGDYAFTVKSTILTGKRKSPETPDPQLAEFKNKRLIVMNEIGNDYVKSDRFKDIFSGGGDLLNARPLYKKPITFKITHHAFILSNNVINIQIDGGVERRILYIQWPIKFVTNPMGSNQEFADEYFIFSLNNNKQVLEQFMAILINNYKKIHSKLETEKNIELVMDVPKKIIDITNKMMNQVFSFDIFINDVLKSSPGSEIPISLLYERLELSLIHI